LLRYTLCFQMPSMLYIRIYQVTNSLPSSSISFIISLSISIMCFRVTYVPIELAA
jgi:hypothetical protein